MKLQVEFLSMPVAVKIVGKKSISINFRGSTVIELIRQLTKMFGEKLSNYLLDEKGNIDKVFTIMVNGEIQKQNGEMERQLKDGDKLTMMLLVAGG